MNETTLSLIQATSSSSLVNNNPDFLNTFSNFFSNQTFLTIISGVAVFTIGQAIQNFILKPLQDFYHIIGDISHKVKFHSNILTNSGLKKNLVDWASGDMRDLSCNLESRYIVIPFKTLLSLLKMLPSKKNVQIACQMLIFLSNAGGTKRAEIQNSEAIDKLKQALNISLN